MANPINKKVMRKNRSFALLSSVILAVVIVVALFVFSTDLARDFSDSVKSLVRDAREVLFAPPSSALKRAFSANIVPADGEFFVTLSFSISNPPDPSYGEFHLIDETIPSGFIIVDSGGMNTQTQSHLKIAALDNSPTEYRYKIRAPSQRGEYIFSGIYQTDRMNSPDKISGAGKIIVNGRGKTGAER